MKKIKIVLLLTACFYAMSTTQTSAQVSVGISVSAYIAPPPLPFYSQPPCPIDGYMWAPGYWAYADGGYFWVPGVWVLPPQLGYYWTPGYWGYAGGMYGFHTGYWGTRVGYYGGINYGYGYGGSGFGGGRWEGNSFRYNTAVVSVNRSVIHNTYVDRTVIVNNQSVAGKRTSYNGGPGGISARPTTQQQSSPGEHHIPATTQQVSHVQSASRDKNQFATVNQGHPSTTAMNTPSGHKYGQVGTVSNAHAIPTLPTPNNTHAQQTTPVQNHNATIDHSSALHQASTRPATVHQQAQYNPAPGAQQQSHHNPSQGTQQQQHNNPSQGTQQQQHNNPSPRPQQQPNNAPQQHNAPHPQGESPHQKDH
jgi:hypothetical protein